MKMLPGVGFFGSGKLAEIIIKQLQENGFTIEGIWSSNIDECKRLSEAYSIPIQSTIIDKILLLPNVQLIVTSCPPHYHNQIATKACGIGKHVICDWPPSYTLNDMIKMRNAALNYPSLITLLLTGLRFLPTFSILRRLIIEDHFLGHIRLINATVMCDVISVYNEKSIIWDKHMGGGLLSLYGTNIIDIISFITDYRAYRVHGMINCFKQLSTNAIRFNTTEDFVNFQMELKPMKNTKTLLNELKDDPIMANIQLNGHYYNCQPKHEIYIYGTKGYIVFRDGDLYAYKTTTSTTAINYELSRLNGGSDYHFYDLDSYNQNNNHEILLYKLQDLASTPISTTATATTTNKYMTTTYNVYPKIYLIGINLMIKALKNAFRNNQCNNSSSMDDNNNNGDNDLKENHNLINKINNDNNSNKSINLIDQKIILQNNQYKKRLKTTSTTTAASSSTSTLIKWIKDPVNMAITFDDGIYIQTVLESIRKSSDQRQWVNINRHVYA